jgi:hypothetical protein
MSMLFQCEVRGTEVQFASLPNLAHILHCLLTYVIMSTPAGISGGCFQRSEECRLRRPKTGPVLRDITKTHTSVANLFAYVHSGRNMEYPYGSISRREV